MLANATIERKLYHPECIHEIWPNREIVDFWTTSKTASVAEVCRVFDVYSFPVTFDPVEIRMPVDRYPCKKLLEKEFEYIFYEGTRYENCTLASIIAEQELWTHVFLCDQLPIMFDTFIDSPVLYLSTEILS